MIGIYKIVNIDSNNVYIGQSKNIERRWKEHKNALFENYHHQFNLQREFNNYKKKIILELKNNDLFKYLDVNQITLDRYYKFEVVEEFKEYDKDLLLRKEDEYILNLRSNNKGYKQKTNIEILANGNNILDDETIKNILDEVYNKYPDFKNDTIDNKYKTELQENYINNKITLKGLTLKLTRYTRRKSLDYLDKLDIETRKEFIKFFRSIYDKYTE